MATMTFFLGDFLPCDDKINFIVTHSKDFVKKKEPKSLVIEEIIFQITIFKP
jgi:hypothetical protein